MNNIYNLAIIEGYLLQHESLPQMIKDAISFLKAELSASTVETKAKRKWKMTKEQREKNNLLLADMRARKKAKREAEKAI